MTTNHNAVWFSKLLSKLVKTCKAQIRSCWDARASPLLYIICAVLASFIIGVIGMTTNHNDSGMKIAVPFVVCGALLVAASWFYCLKERTKSARVVAAASTFGAVFTVIGIWSGVRSFETTVDQLVSSTDIELVNFWNSNMTDQVRYRRARFVKEFEDWPDVAKSTLPGPNAVGTKVMVSKQQMYNWFARMASSTLASDASGLPKGDRLYNLITQDSEYQKEVNLVVAEKTDKKNERLNDALKQYDVAYRGRVLSDYRTALVNTLNTFEAVCYLRRLCHDHSTAAMIDREYASSIIRYTNELWPFIYVYRKNSNKDAWMILDDVRNQEWRDVGTRITPQLREDYLHEYAYYPDQRVDKSHLPADPAFQLFGK